MDKIQVELSRVPMGEVKRKMAHIRERMLQLESKEYKSHYDRWLTESYRKDWEECLSMTTDYGALGRGYIYRIGNVFIPMEKGEEIWKHFKHK